MSHLSFEGQFTFPDCLAISLLFFSAELGSGFKAFCQASGAVQLPPFAHSSFWPQPGWKLSLASPDTE